MSLATLPLHLLTGCLHTFLPFQSSDFYTQPAHLLFALSSSHTCPSSAPHSIKYNHTQTLVLCQIIPASFWSLMLMIFLFLPVCFLFGFVCIHGSPVASSCFPFFSFTCSVFFSAASGSTQNVPGMWHLPKRLNNLKPPVECVCAYHRMTFFCCKITFLLLPSITGIHSFTLSLCASVCFLTDGMSNDKALMRRRI